MTCSSGCSRSWLQSRVAARVWWRTTRRRPPVRILKRSSRRSTSCAGERWVDAGGGELDGERDPVEAAAELGDGRLACVVGADERRPPRGLASSNSCIGLGRHGRAGVTAYTCSPSDGQRLTAGREQPRRPRACEDGVGDLRDRVEHVLAVVEDAEDSGALRGRRLIRSMGSSVRIGRARTLAIGGRHRVVVRRRGEVGERDPVRDSRRRRRLSDGEWPGGSFRNRPAPVRVTRRWSASRLRRRLRRRRRARRTRSTAKGWRCRSASPRR